MPDAVSPVHLRPVAAVADRVLLPGDPGRALALAQVVLGDDRKMFNHHHGLWGYTGTAADGAPLTIQSTGIGGPSAAVVLEELAALGVTSAMRVGLGTALDAGLALGDLIAATEVVPADGVGRALGTSDRLPLDAGLAAALVAGGARAATIVSHDVFHGPPAEVGPADAQARDLETAALAAVSARRGLRFGAVLAVAFDASGARLDDDALDHAGEVVGRAGAAALVCG
jgi:uridine phosphorylase